MKNIKKSAIAFCFLLAFVACRKDETLPTITTPPPGLGGDSATNTTIDKWLLDSLTNPYNISVLYKYSPWNTDLYYNVTPVQEDKIIPFFSALNRTWIVPYNQETGSAAFIKQNCSKQLVLIGSVEYDAYTVKLGQAEGGNNIVFFDVNQHFDTDPITSIKRVIHTAHHEFGHNLNQRIAVSPDFQGLSAKASFPNYTATWFNISDATALTYGYPTAYAMASADEDFVEMLSVMLTTGKSKWDEMKASVPAAAAAVLQQKEDFVVKYMLQAWNIDFYSLQRRVQAAINALFPPPTVDAVYGSGKTYTTARMNPTSSLLPQSAGFTSIFNTSKTAVAAIPSYGLVLDSMAVVTNTATSAVVRCYMHQGTATTVFLADFTHTLTKDAGGLYSYTYVSANGNATIIKTAVTPLLNYFVSGKFAIDWYADPSVSNYPRVKFTPQATPASYFIARLFP